MSTVEQDMWSLRVQMSVLQGRLNLMETFDERLRDMEVEVGQLKTSLDRNTQILDDIRSHLNKPINYPAWAGAFVAVVGLIGGLLYTAYISPLERDVERLEAITSEREYLIEDYKKHKRAAEDGRKG